MKTLVLIGSPHKDGESARLAQEVTKHVNGDIEYLYIFDYINLKSCIDCGYCVTHAGCAIGNDGFIDILDKIEKADAYILASDIWFSNFPGPVMNFFSRMQTWTCGHIFRHDMTNNWDKAGILITTSNHKFHSMGKYIENIAEYAFNHFDALILDTIHINALARKSLFDSPYDKKSCCVAARKLNEWFIEKQKEDFVPYGYTSESNVRLLSVNKQGE